MSQKVTTPVANALLNLLKNVLDGGFCHIYSGPVPADADDDITGSNTLLATLSVDGDGTTGLTFATPSSAILSKNPAEDWLGEIAASGTPTFFRFVGEDGAIQGTVGGPTSSADMRLGTDTLTAGGSNTVGVSIFNVRLSALA